MKLEEIEFVNLHCHSEHSLLDGCGSIPEILNKIEEQKQKAVAITDHGNCNNFVQVYFGTEKKNIKPIFACEFYFSEDLSDKKSKRYHLILLAKNQIGFTNILKLNAFAHSEGFYSRPRIDFKALKNNNEGIICLSGCVSGIVPNLILKNKNKSALKWANKFKSLFGKDYYLELQVHDFSDQVIANKGLLKISKELKIKTVITNDAHYLDKGDHIIQDVKGLLRQKKTWKDRQEALDRIKKGEKAKLPWEIHTKQLWFKDKNEVYEAWYKWHKEYFKEKEFIESMNESFLISEKVERFKLDTSAKYPIIDTKGEDVKEFFKRKIDDGFADRGLNIDDKKYTSQLGYEYKVLCDLGLEAYFLILSDVILWAKKNNIMVGVGRGSAAGSLISYCLGITGIDPIEHELMFERFINPGRKELPDIDVDFEVDGREKVKAYIEEKYGSDKVIEVGAFGMFKTRSAIKDVTRVMGGDYRAANELSIALDDEIDGYTDDDGIKIEYSIPEVKEKYKDLFNEFCKKNEMHEKILDIALKLRNHIRHMTKHPAGVIVLPKPADESIAVYRHKGKLISGWTEGTYRKELTPLGFVKYDILGLKTLDIIKFAMKMIKKRYNESIDIDHLPLDDKKVYKIAAKGRSLGTFQFETGNMQRLLRDLRPTEFNDLSALNSLDRPGPLDMGMEKVYFALKNKESNEEIDEMIKPAMKKLFPKTYGVILYQEQVMETAKRLAGFSLEEADKLRKLLVKRTKSGEEERKEQMKKMRKQFISQASENIKEKDAIEIWTSMAKFARYGFNKAHSVSYAMIGYMCFWLKVNYCIEFVASILSFSKSDKTLFYIKDALHQGIKVLPVDISKSKKRFTIDNDAIRFPLIHIKYVNKCADAIIEGAPYKSFSNFIEKVKGKRVNKNAVVSLIKAGAFDEFGSRDKIHYKYMKLKAKKKDRENIEFEKWGMSDILKYEKDAYGFEFNSSLIEEVFIKLKELGCEKISKELDKNVGSTCHIGGIVRNIKEHKTEKGIMAFLDIQYFNKNTSITVFADRWQRLKEKIFNGSFVYGQVTLSEYGTRRNFILNNRNEDYLKVYSSNE